MQSDTSTRVPLEIERFAATPESNCSLLNLIRQQFHGRQKTDRVSQGAHHAPLPRLCTRPSQLCKKPCEDLLLVWYPAGRLQCTSDEACWFMQDGTASKCPHSRYALRPSVEDLLLIRQARIIPPTCFGSRFPSSGRIGRIDAAKHTNCF